MARSRQGTIPLAWRVPNPPASFVGRRSELRAIQAAARRGPVVVLAGPGGLGKTALACAAVRGPLSKRAARAVIVRAEPDVPFAQVLLDAARALGRTAMRSDADLAMHVLDVAEARGALVVLDDLHNVLPEATALLVAAARYARRSLWLATSRVEPRAPELAGQVVRVGALTERDLAALARTVDGSLSPTAARRIARDAKGSPWKARQLASGELDTAPDQASLLSTLSAVQRPISRDALAAAIGAEPRVQGLVRRGLVEAVAGGYRLHDQARALVKPSAPRQVVEALAGGTATEALEALRLALQHDDEESAVAVCAASFDRLLRGGYAPTLWALLLPRSAARWHTYKLRTAMQLADVKITTLLDEPPHDALLDRLLWVRALLLESKLAEALAAANALCRDVEKGADPPIAFWAWLEHAMAARVQLGPGEGLARIQHVTPVDRDTEALSTALRAFWLAEAGQVEESVRVLERSAGVARADPTHTPFAEEILGGPIDFFVRYYRMAAFMECGQLERAHAEITTGRDDGALDVTLRASYVQLDGIANLSIARGRLDEASGILDRLLRRAPDGSSTYHTIARLLDVERRIAAGSFAPVTADLDRLLEETRGANALVHAWCIDARERLHIVCAVREVAPLDHDVSPLGEVARSVLALRRALRRARWGEEAELLEPRDIEGAIVHALASATRALLHGRDAIADARRAVDLAARHGWAIREQEARGLLAEALVSSGDVAAALAETRTMAKAAAAMPSPRFELEARLLATLLEEPPIDAAVLEEIASRDDVSPMAARRARALLGERSARLDEVDRHVVASILKRAGVDVVRVHASAVFQRGWGLDVRRRSVWLPDGRRVSFARHALLAKVLEVLGRRGGTASFDDLAHEVWQRRDFHPLHDGNRMRVTLHRLRALVEDDPRKPRRVVLGASSYELGPEPFTLVAPSQPV